MPAVRQAVRAPRRLRVGGTGLAGGRAGHGALPPPLPPGCRCPVPATVTAPGPPKAIGKGLLSNAFIAMLITERYVAGRSQNSLVTGLARHGAEVCRRR